MNSRNVLYSAPGRSSEAPSKVVLTLRVKGPKKKRMSKSAGPVPSRLLAAEGSDEVKVMLLHTRV